MNKYILHSVGRYNDIEWMPRTTFSRHQCSNRVKLVFLARTAPLAGRTENTMGLSRPQYSCNVGKLKYHSYVITACGLCCFVYTHSVYIHVLQVRLYSLVLWNFHGRSLFRNTLEPVITAKNATAFFFHGPVHTSAESNVVAHSLNSYYTHTHSEFTTSFMCNKYVPAHRVYADIYILHLDFHVVSW